jgi:2',3'-cyclic-nucleotide 2'-phosphodiesterase (5'-nucleotidase family)
MKSQVKLTASVLLLLALLARLDVATSPLRAAVGDQLLVHLTFDDTLADASGRGHHGAAVGTTPFVAGKVGAKAVALSSKADGSAFNYVTLGSPAALNFGTDTDFSVSFWVKFSQWKFDPPLVSNKDWASGQNPGWMIATGTDGRLQWNYSGAPGLRKDYDGPAGTLSDGQWHHVVVTFLRAGEWTTFLDGQVVDTRDVTVSSNNLNTPAGFAVNIGQDGTGRYTDGGTVGIEDLQMDDLGIWGRVLTSSEAKAIFQAGLAGQDLATIVSSPEPPTLAAAPAGADVVAGQEVALRVLPRGTSPFTYQWFKDGQPLANATTAVLRLSDAQGRDAGRYTVEVRNGAGSATSPEAIITVDTTQPPVILTQPRSATAALGGRAAFDVVASGVLPISYQWSRDGQPLGNATESALVLENVQPGSAGVYSVTVRAGNGQTTASADARLTVVDDIRQGLVAHLTFDSDYSDASGRGNHGSAQGVPSIIAGHIGPGALRFTHDGSKFNFVTLGVAEDLDFSVDADFSFSFWIRFSQFNRDPVFLSNKSWIGSGANIGYALGTGADGRFQWNFREQVGERADYDSPPKAISDGHWHHVGVSFQRGSDARTYLDGVLVNTQPLPTSGTTIQPGFPTNIGQDGTGSYSEGGEGRIDDGTIDDVAIWRRTVTGEEFMAIYRKGTTLGANVQERPISDGLVLHLPFDQGLDDNSGRGNNGRAVGTPRFVTGKLGSGALGFSSAANGASFNYVTLGAPADLEFGADTDFTVAMWIRFKEWTGDPAFLGNKDWTSGGNQGWVIATGGNGRFQWNLGDGDAGGRTRQDYDGPGGTLSGGTWHHIVVSIRRSGDTVSYLDGQPVATNSLTADLGSISTPAGLAVNVGQDGRGSYTDNGEVGISDGEIDDLALWRRALTTAEIAAIYQRALRGRNVLNQTDVPPVIPQLPVRSEGVLFTRNGVDVFNSGYGSSLAKDPAQPDLYYLMTDRGPNFDTADLSGKVFPIPDYTPRIGVFRRVGGELRKERDILMQASDGTPLNGLPNPIGAGGTGEIALDLAGQTLALSPLGVDPEGLALAPDGSFWIADEYGPHILHLDPTGRTIERINPFGTGVGGRKLPKVFAARRANRGMEGMTMTPDGTKVVGIMQSPLDNPASARSAIRANSRVTRILVFDVGSGATQQYVYVQERAGLLNSEIVALSNTDFVVLERDGNFPASTNAATVFKRFYQISLAGATDISDPQDAASGRMIQVGAASKTLEQATLLEVLDAGVVPVRKQLYLDLIRELSTYAHDKPEGFAVLPDGKLEIINDDDFGIDTDGMGGIAPKRLPATGAIDHNRLVVVGLTPVVTEGFTLQLIHSSDNESSLQDPNTLEKKVLGYSAIQRGLEQLATREGMASVHVTVGDHTLPGPFYRAAADVPQFGAAGLGDIELYNAMGLRANGMGNHEFDGGLDDFARMLAAARYPFIAVNMDFTRAEVGAGVPAIAIGADAGSVEENAGKVVRSAYVEIRGQRIGLIGRAPASFFQVIADPATTLPGVDFVGGRDGTGLPKLSALPMVLEQVDLLKAKGINKIILLDHAQDFTTDPLAASALRDIDIVVTAGSTGFYAKSKASGPFNLLRPGDTPAADYPLQRSDANGQPLLVVNAEQLYRYVGHLIVRFNDQGIIDFVDPRSGPVATSDAGVAALATQLVVPTLRPATAVQAAFDALAGTPVITDLNTVVGTTAHPLNGARAAVRSRETNLGRLASDSTLWFADRYLASQNDLRKVDVALKNGGGIRNSILGPNVTKFTIGAALAFNNQLSIIEVTAAELIATLENAVSRFPAADGRFPQVAGLSVEFDPEQPGLAAQASVTVPSRVRMLTVRRSDGTLDVVVEDRQPQGDLSRRFVLATNGFLATGGDGYESLKSASTRGAILTTVGEQQVLVDYIAGPLAGRVELPEPLFYPRIVQTFPELNYHAWSQRFYTPGLAGTSDAEDFDKDGLSNLDEFAFGRNPLEPDADEPLVQAEARADAWVVRFARTKGATLAWSFARTASLAEPMWRLLLAGADYQEQVADLGDGIERVTLILPPNADTNGFISIRVE